MPPQNEQLVMEAACSRAPSVQVPLWKRGLDVGIVLISLPLLIPLSVLIALFIRCVSKGPVLFRQERIGFLGRRFMCFKFRTMKCGADVGVHQAHLGRLIDSDEPMVKMDSKGDSRVIPGGFVLRSSGLDELPQLINVLRGEMSMVGPRPCVPFEFEKHLAWQKKRYSTLPGLTGLWQVSGKNNTTFAEMIHFDLEYGRRKSLMFDLQIMLRTIPALLDQMLDSRRRRGSFSTVSGRAVVSAPQARR